MLDRRRTPSEQWPTWLDRRADVPPDWHDTIIKAKRETRRAQSSSQNGATEHPPQKKNELTPSH